MQALREAVALTVVTHDMGSNAICGRLSTESPIAALRRLGK